MKHKLLTTALPAALAAAVVLAGCAPSDTSSTSGARASAAAGSGTSANNSKNAADIEFAKMMIPHHAQAIEMADLALKQATDPTVKALAPKIKAAQAPEISLMTRWLTGWGEAAPGTAGGHDMSGMGENTGGMMSAQEMTDLGKANGSAFDRMWLQMMIKHHEGAVEQARTVLAKGLHPETKTLAQAIIDSQSAEIAEMNSILAKIPT
ncbi:MAG: DUF305 domain-containing protein [Candidatus Phosphoribacter sp.]